MKIAVNKLFQFDVIENLTRFGSETFEFFSLDVVLTSVNVLSFKSGLRDVAN